MFRDRESNSKPTKHHQGQLERGILEQDGSLLQRQVSLSTLQTFRDTPDGRWMFETQTLLHECE